MASYNRVILLGNMTRDVELRYTQGGTAVTDIGLAVNDRRKSQTGEWVDETTFVDVTLWGRTAEVASEYLSKGSPVLVEGRLKLDTWETEGQKRSKLRVVCDRMQMLGSGGGSGGGHREVGGDEHSFHEPSHHSAAPSNPASAERAGGDDFSDPNIPF
ncbi:Single-stranded DNA-binding protein [Rosistilla carotiformis]|uniref:Single-stranded DNA-binding protein n=1 Tax=Rosistilla carotiformis TaxID=2528017 RepID=A0A518JQB8_9BACT|nr:single-stranded DNA-binding protein [Rosistilla carotiformis]QDV67733.1 Single-stranded DNA-binding protein [Rosistilla carotiformis]